MDKKLKREINLQVSGLCVREAEDGQKSRTVEGYAVVFGVRSVNLTPWSSDREVYEIMEPGSITPDLLSRSDVVLTAFHNNQMILGRWRMGKGTLTLELDQRGLKIRCTLAETATADELLAAIERGDITGMSFAFTADEEDNVNGVVYEKTSERAASGKVVWGTSPTDSYGGRLDEYGDPIPLHSKVKSAIIIEYIDPTVSKVYSANSYKDCTQNGHYTVKEIENGIEVTYYFEEFKISVPVAYTYKNGVVRLSVDSSRITEAENKLYSVALAPYSCGVYNLAEDGYLFVPSGSGAIIKPRQLETGLYSYSRELYGEDATRYRERELDSEKFPENLLAVYGAKTSDNTALCAIIEKGAEHAFIEAEVGALNTNYSSVWPKFAFRAYQWSKIKNEQQVKLYSDDMSQDTVSVAFHLLDGDNADYVGMANTYREYLTDKYGMQTSNDDSLLNLKIVGGVNITETVLGFKYDKFYQTTTLSQAKDMISDLSSAVDGTITADLIGFGQSGIDVKTIAGGYTVASKLGGEKGLKELSKLAKKNDCNLFFNVDVLGFSNSGKGISKEFDTALAQNNQKIKHVESRTRNFLFRLRSFLFFLIHIVFLSPKLCRINRKYWFRQYKKWRQRISVLGIQLLR